MLDRPIALLLIPILIPIAPMPRILKNHKKISTPSSDSSESLNTTETPIKLEEVSEEEIETYLVPARKLSVEEAKLARKEFEKHKKLLTSANKKVIRQLEGFFLDSVAGHEDESLPFEVFLDKLHQTDPGELRKHSVKNSIRVTRLTQLFKFASHVHQTGEVPINRNIRSKLWDTANGKDV